MLPDEDAWVLPQFWCQEVHPRRGGCPGPTRVVPPDAAGQLHAWLSSERTAESLRRVAERDVIFDPVLLAEGRRYLAGWPQEDPSVLGAAVSTPLTSYGLKDAEHSVDAWVSRSGGSRSPPGSSASWPASSRPAPSGRSTPPPGRPMRPCGGARI